MRTKSVTSFTTLFPIGFKTPMTPGPAATYDEAASAKPITDKVKAAATPAKTNVD